MGVKAQQRRLDASDAQATLLFPSGDSWLARRLESIDRNIFRLVNAIREAVSFPLMIP